MLGTEFTPKQKDVLLNARSRWNFLVGAVRSGKTFALNALTTVRLRNNPGTPRAIIGKTETTIKRNVLQPMQEQLPDGAVSDIYKRERLVDIFGVPHYVIGANNDLAIDKIKGISLQYAYGDEITTWPEGFFEMLKSRLDKKGAKFDGSTNPEGPNHWFKTSMLDRDDLDTYYKHFVLDDNTFLDDEFVEQLKNEYSGVWYARYIEGKWVKAEGLVYDNFSEDDHVVSELPDKFKKFWIGIDYGTVNPTHFNLLGLSKDNELYLIDEWRHSGDESGRSKTDAEYSQALQAFIARQQDRFKNFVAEWVFIDPSAKSFIEQLNRDGTSRLAPADNSVLDGIRKVSTLIGADKLKIHKSCENTIDEFHAYSWDEKAEERGEDKPIKSDDHSLDSLRYVINSFGKKYYNLVMRG